MENIEIIAQIKTKGEKPLVTLFKEDGRFILDKTLVSPEEGTQIMEVLSKRFLNATFLAYEDDETYPGFMTYSKEELAQVPDFISDIARNLTFDERKELQKHLDQVTSWYVRGAVKADVLERQKFKSVAQVFQKIKLPMPVVGIDL